MFKLSDIKAGYLLQVRTGDGDIVNMTVVPSKAFHPHPITRLLLDLEPSPEGGLACGNGNGFWPLNVFDDDLDFDGEKVVAVYGYTHPRGLLANSTEDRELLWKREEEEPEKAPDYVEVRKMTQAEIRELLGYEVEIVEG